MSKLTTMAKIYAHTALLLTFISPSYGQSVTAIGRYLSIDNHGQFAQYHPLLQSIQVRFGKDIKTVGDAIHRLLTLTGYSLVSKEKISQEVLMTLEKPLPVVDRQLGPLSVREGLLILVGNSFLLVEDPVNRQVNFQLKKQYKKH